MRSKLGPVNLALISIYFVPVWGTEAVQALTSPYNGFEHRVHAAAAIFFREWLDLGLNGLIRASHILAGIKLVIAAGFVAYLVEFARSLVTDRDVDRHTIEVVLILAAVGIAIWAVPAMALDDGGLVRLYATQLLMVVGAIFVITVDRQFEKAPEDSCSATVEREWDASHALVNAELARTAARMQPSQTAQS